MALPANGEVRRGFGGRPIGGRYPTAYAVASAKAGKGEYGAGCAAKESCLRQAGATNTALLRVGRVCGWGIRDACHPGSGEYQRYP